MSDSAKHDLRLSEAEDLLIALRKLKKKGSWRNDVGLCAYVSCETSGVLPQDLVNKWPEHSGNPSFPIPHPDWPAPYGYLMCRNKWDKRTEYGKARWRLVDFLIEKLEEIVNESNS